MPVIKEVVKIDEYPTKIAQPKEGAEVTIGDLDGNALKCLYFLVREGVLQISPQDYVRLTAIYKTPTDKITKETLAEFNSIIQKATVVKPTPEIIFIGDTLCDRGMNDYYTLKLYEKLHSNNVNFTVLHSNHDAEFLKQYAAGLDKGNITNYKDAQAFFGNSLLNLQTLIKNKLVTLEEVEDLLVNYYLPHLKLFITEQLSATQVNLYTHAPSDPYSIRDVADDLSVPYNDKTVNSFRTTLININEQFKKVIFDKKKLALVLAMDGPNNFVLDRYSHLAEVLKQAAVEIYKRDYSVMNIHGHVGSEIPATDVKYLWDFLNIDSPVGKGDERADTYVVLTNNTNYLASNPPVEKETLAAAAAISKQNIFTTAQEAKPAAAAAPEPPATEKKQP